MLITFRTKPYADITMFGDVALELLHMMGHSGSVPGALMPEDIPGALAALEEALSAQAPAAEPPDTDEEEPPVPLARRAAPLIALLQAAQAQQEPVMWDK
ncbi:MAG: DUF1840 domain-containing protein [Pseudomonadota bacterium]